MQASSRRHARARLEAPPRRSGPASGRNGAHRYGVISPVRPASFRSRSHARDVGSTASSVARPRGSPSLLKCLLASTARQTSATSPTRSTRSSISRFPAGRGSRPTRRRTKRSCSGTVTGRPSPMRRKAMSPRRSARADSAPARLALSSRRCGRSGSGSAAASSRSRTGRTARWRRFLTDLPELGHKSAACIMAMSLGRDAFAVDVHVGRVMSRVAPYGVLGLDLASLEHRRRQVLIPAVVPPRLRRDLHINMLLHGREVCRPRAVCARCVIRRQCSTGHASAVPGPAG